MCTIVCGRLPVFLAELFYFLETLFRCVVYRCDGATRSRLPFYLFINLPFYHVRLIVARGVQSYKVWDTWCRLLLKYWLILFESRKMRHKVSVALEAIIYRMLCESSKPVGCWTQSVVESAGTCIDYRLRGSRLMVFAITEVMLSWRQRNQRWFCMINR